ncbi:MAG: hypothetical protein Q4A13_01535 [Fretibacterium sp.]|uniref:hypothetical protein n=1 Tax=Fretibacterium sp. OH1220_COT-178 TaxID=2491047 RepID=UPI000F5EB9BF|nr:hypothetical protein [Fretibacterium sp. OH1220_COT-178]MDO4785598.1 hypothetical protein [Fretibacterium sp.]RRD64610.1 hypothetical protein EII26_06705 [Fretibacterium sp. OH1220_COT-178]
MSHYDKLGEHGEMWTYLGFEPWEHRGMAGVARKITMTKTSLLGPVARYYAWDYVVWRHGGDADVDYLMREWKPMPDVIMQRFLLVGSSLRGRRARSFLLGFRGFLEVYGYLPGVQFHKKVADLVPPVELALKEERA